MKKLSTIVFLLLGYLGHAQNYSCLQSGVKHYFTNSNGYLRGIRTDSTIVSPDSTIFYLYHTPRGYYDNWGTIPLDSNGGSWLGKRVVQKIDGTFLFDNHWHDSIIIKTQAVAGDTWVFYQDTTPLYYQALLLAKDTMTVLGVTDSVKTILITARNASGIVASDPVDSFELILSKNNGFVQVFDLYTFPYHAPDSTYVNGLDYYLDMSLGNLYAYHSPPSKTNSIFSLLALLNPTTIQLYNWNVGDVYEYSQCFDPDISLVCYDYSYDRDSITAKFTAMGTEQYHFTGAEHAFNPLVPFTTADSGYTKLAFDSTLLIATTYMPEEYRQTKTYYYSPEDSSFCYKSAKYEVEPNYLDGVRNIAYWFEGPMSDYQYKIGLGRTHYYFSYIDSYYYIEQSDLQYFSNSIGTCGTFHSVAITDPGNVRKTELSPNPASTELTVTSTSKINSIAITNLLGQTVYAHEFSSEKAVINVAAFPVGLYLVRINGTEVKKFVKD